MFVFKEAFMKTEKSHLKIKKKTEQLKLKFCLFNW